MSFETVVRRIRLWNVACSVNSKKKPQLTSFVHWGYCRTLYGRFRCFRRFLFCSISLLIKGLFTHGSNFHIHFHSENCGDWDRQKCCYYHNRKIFKGSSLVFFVLFCQPLMVSNVMTTFATKQAAIDNTNAVTIVL